MWVVRAAWDKIFDLNVKAAFFLAKDVRCLHCCERVAHFIHLVCLLCSAFLT
jgi:hypothetical protein